MKAARIQFGFLWLTVSLVAAQTPAPANVQKVNVRSDGNEVRVELTLSSSVSPSVVVATNPDRLVLELPNTLSDGKQKRVSSSVPGVRGVRLGLHQADPPVTHLVVDLEQGTPYRLETDHNRITLVLSPPAAATASRHQAPARPVSGGLAGIFRSGSKPVAPPPSSDAENASIPFPGSSTSSSTSTVAAAPQPEAKHTAAAGESFPGIASAQPAASATPAPVAPAPSISPKPEPAATPEPASAAPASVVASEETPAPAKATETVASASGTSGLTTDQTLLALQAADPNLRTVFRVKYVADGVAYLDGGSTSGLGEQMKLEVRDTNLPVRQGETATSDDPNAVAELEITAVADTSAVADIHNAKRPVKVGDLAYLSAGDAQALIQQRTLSATRKYPAVVTFTEPDAMDEEGRDEVPRPPLPSVNRARGMFGFDYMGTQSLGSSSMMSSNLGFVTRVDITRIGGTYWNARGYWRGRINKESAGQQTLQDLINRTYHLNMTYENPQSRFVAGFGRLYLPYATSLDTIDGGYAGFRFSKIGTAGIFAGSTPDPTSYSYNPDGKIGGAFINFEGGSYEDTHFLSTSGFGVKTVKWEIDRPFVFLENNLSYKRILSIYDALQADSPRGNPATPAPGAGLSRNFLTVRIQPVPRIEFDINHTYFRDIPTYDPNLLGTGLLDKYLFQGFSAGVRFEAVKGIWLYTDLGQSNRTGDAKTSLNQSYGITFNRIPRLGLHADLHYSQFSSSFGTGSYRAFSISRHIGETYDFSVLFGDQSFNSSATTSDHSKFVTSNFSTAFGKHYFLQSGFTISRGTMEYNQWLFTLGYRFDSRDKKQQ